MPAKWIVILPSRSIGVLIEQRIDVLVEDV
jgi:hypothetical protein